MDHERDHGSVHPGTADEVAGTCRGSARCERKGSGLLMGTHMAGANVTGRYRCDDTEATGYESQNENSAGRPGGSRSC